MTLTEIKTAVHAGKTVHWESTGYKVIVDADQWFILCDRNNHRTDLILADGTLNGQPKQFYLGLDEVEQRLRILYEVDDRSCQRCGASCLITATGRPREPREIAEGHGWFIDSKVELVDGEEIELAEIYCPNCW